jgi:tetratricopeptide (TPR) repeat protein
MPTTFSMMSARLNQIVIWILVLIAIIALVYLIDYIFSTSSKDNIAEYQAKLVIIDNALNNDDYETALSEIAKHLNEDEKDLFQVNLQARKAICLINQGDLLRSKAIFERLIEIYPFIKLSQDVYRSCRVNEDYINYAGLIIDGTETLNSIHDSKPGIGEVFSHLKRRHYLQITYITSIVILLLERRRRLKKTNA